VGVGVGVGVDGVLGGEGGDGDEDSSRAIRKKQAQSCSGVAEERHGWSAGTCAARGRGGVRSAHRPPRPAPPRSSLSAVEQQAYWLLTAHY